MASQIYAAAIMTEPETYLGLWQVTEPMRKGVEERHQFSDISRHLDRLLHPLRVVKRALDQILECVETPFCVVLREHDLRVQQVGLEGLVIHLHLDLEPVLLNSALATPNRFFHRVCSASQMYIRAYQQRQ